MELLWFVVLIFVVAGLSSKSEKRGPSYPSITSPIPQKPAVERSRTQISKPTNTERYGSRGVFAGTGNSSPITTNDSAVFPDESCNKCGKSWRRWENTDNGGYWYSCSGWPRCDNTRDKQMREKFCSNGHRRTSSNTAYTADGHRRCLICRPYPEKKDPIVRSSRNTPNRSVSSAVAHYKSKDLDKFCRNGHRRTDENTYVRPDGERECRICRRIARK